MAFNKAKVLQEAEKLVTQGKISQAIKRYFDIFEMDPSELILLNTIGDLYIRDRNVSEGLKQFYRLAEAYVQDGFTLKAIAIYKKIVKLEPDSVDPLLRLVELYQAQRLGREARELYYQVAEYYKKKKQNDKALEILHKSVQLDVENATARARLSAFCEEIGRKDEAAQVHLETAQLALRRGDAEAAQIALKKAQELAPDDPQIQLLRAREALLLKRPEEVEAILSATPQLKDDPVGRSLLIDSYLATRQPEKAETLVLDLFRATPADFSPLASFVSVCVEVGQFDAASRALSVVADELIKQGKTSSLMQSLRLIWSKSPQHLPTLELIFRICSESGDEYALPEILEALGNAYMQCGQFEKAEQSFQRLVSREPTNERYKVLLRQVFQKQGKESGRAHVADLPSSAAAPAQEEGVASLAAAAVRAAAREAMVKEALENSELFIRYHLVGKAVAELDKVLEAYPDEIEIHRRLVGMCWKDMPERAELAAQALARIYTQQGDAEGARRFAQMAGGQEALAAAVPLQAARAPAVSPGPLPPLPAQPAAAASEGIDLASEFSLTPVQEAEAAPPPQVSSTASAGVTFELVRPPQQEAAAATPPEFPSDLPAVPGVESPTTTAPIVSLDPSVPSPLQAPPQAPPELPLDLVTLAPPPPPPPSPQTQEIDLSEDWESFLARTATASPAPEAPPVAASFNYEDSRTEVNFYLEQGFFEEARKAILDLERAWPGNPRVAELRALVEANAGGLGAEVTGKQPAEALKFTSLEAVAPPAEKAVARREQASSFAAPKPKARPAASPPFSPREEGIPRETTLDVSVEASTNLLGDLTEAFESAMGGLEEPFPLPAPPSAATAGPATGSAAPTPAPASPLSELLEEIGEAPGTGAVQEEDPETHYNLGVAFREMNLLDEAIGEFQKVVKGAAKTHLPPNYLQACTLLATCFMEKGMASLAAKWYSRALETPGLDEGAWLALQYDLGVAYEQAGDLPRALERFSEVYGQNIDFRDVAEKIRTYQQKGS